MQRAAEPRAPKLCVIEIGFNAESIRHPLVDLLELSDVEFFPLENELIRIENAGGKEQGKLDLYVDFQEGDRIFFRLFDITEDLGPSSCAAPPRPVRFQLGFRESKGNGTAIFPLEPKDALDPETGFLRVEEENLKFVGRIVSHGFKEKRPCWILDLPASSGGTVGQEFKVVDDGRFLFGAFLEVAIEDKVRGFFFDPELHVRPANVLVSALP